MIATMRLAIAVSIALLPTTALAIDPLPEGDVGIAAEHPNDEGIGDDPAVYFFDDFESYADQTGLWDRWDNTFQQDQTRIATETENVWAGAQSVEFTLPQQDAELSNAVVKAVAPEREVFFLRYYSKFSTPFDLVGSSHNGSVISSHYEDENGQSTPGIPADGTNKFLVAYENWRGEAETMSPGDLNVYVYHPEQRDDYGDHFFPTGLVMPNTSLPFDFGPDFSARPDVIQELDRWYCYELMVLANTPGERDGRIAFWLDGALAADFQNLRLRDVDTLTIDRFAVGFHAGSNTNGEQKKWYDNVVAADSYIGPMYVPGAADSGGSDGGDSSSGGGSSEGGSASATGADSATGGGSATGGSATDSADGSGSGASAGQGDDDSGGCGCRATGPNASAFVFLAALGVPCRRRRRCGSGWPARTERFARSPSPDTSCRHPACGADRRNPARPRDSCAEGWPAS
jgi:MYXO-CTERM domain-containing protein